MEWIWTFEHWDAILVLGILFGFALLETTAGYLRNSKRKRGDWVQEMLSFVLLSTLIQPSIVGAVLGLGMALAPELADVIPSQTFLWFLLPYLLVEDLLQYGYHRLAHQHPFLWKLHRAHHQAEEMGFFVSYRNAFMYYVMMPNLWLIGTVLFMGGAHAVAIGLVLKQWVIIASHSRIPWDRRFYDSSLLKPVIVVLERVVVTPAFHHAHHGRSKADGIGNPNGNFGNMFSIWDQLFGTAHFPRSYPQSYGLQERTDDPWTSSYLYPVVSSPVPRSELARGHVKSRTANREPSRVTLQKGTTYLWCACGLSQNQPFCDGSHHGTHHQPVVFVARRDGPLQLCNCKLSQSPPFCDQSHADFEE